MACNAGDRRIKRCRDQIAQEQEHAIGHAEGTFLTGQTDSRPRSGSRTLPAASSLRWISWTIWRQNIQSFTNCDPGSRRIIASVWENTAKSVSELLFQRGNIVNILNCAKPSERLKCCNKVHKKINSNTGGINDREKTR
jgi:hypothetical protein